MNEISNTQLEVTSGGAVFEERMRQLRGRFVERSRTDIEQIRAVRIRMMAGEKLHGELLRHLLRIVHALSGAAGIFGYDAISEAAFRAERDLRCLEGPSDDIETSLDDLEVRLNALFV